MDDAERGQVSRSAADVYDELFVPALFRDWVGRVADAAEIAAGDRALDVACGTGVLAREIAERVGPRGRVVGLDANPGMLEVAKRRAPDIEWRQGFAESLPFEPASFEVVASQFALMFFEDRVGALREMDRVLAPGGRLVVAVWASLEESPGYARLAEILARRFGDDVAQALHAPFALGDRADLGALFAEAGLDGVAIRTLSGRVRFPSIREWVTTEIRGWTLADRLDERDLAGLVEEAERELRGFADAEGAVAFPIAAHVARAIRGS